MNTIESSTDESNDFLQDQNYVGTAIDHQIFAKELFNIKKEKKR